MRCRFYADVKSSLYGSVVHLAGTYKQIGV